MLKLLDPMRAAYAVLMIGLLTASSSAAAQRRPGKTDWVAQPVVAFPNLKFDRPLYLASPPDGTDRVIVAEQRGRIWLFDNRPDVRPNERTLTLDLTVRRKHNEEGLLGIAFHPDFFDNGQIFIHYSAGGDPDRPNRGSEGRRGIVSRFTFNADRTRIDPNSEQILLEIPQPYGNHNGGHLDFGEDGYLYIAVGDGGSGGDPQNYAQNLTSILGSILRIDVDNQANGKPYAIPEDNPFADPATYRGAQPEIYAYGLRNVWRFSFDHRRHGGTGQLWAADVGQHKREEVNLIVSGGNYGWAVREGFAPFKSKDALLPNDTLLDPVVDLERRDAGSITGGYVYRGPTNPLLQGAYVYGDYLTGKVFLLRADSGRVRQHQHFADISSPASLGIDRNRELHVCSFDGRIYKFTPVR